MLISLASVKGSPGVTSTSLTLASVWPAVTGRGAVLLEADPSGGDLAYRAEAATGGPPAASPSLTTLGADVRQHARAGGTVVARQAQALGCEVQLVPGLMSSTQARGLEALWPAIASACVRSSDDVIADLGRLDPGNPSLPLAQQSEVLVLVAGSSMGSVLHLHNALNALAGAVNAFGFVPVVPVLVGPARSASSDCAEVDEVLASAGAPIHPTRPIAYDPAALSKLLAGTSPGRLGRSALVKTARGLAGHLAELAGAETPSPTADHDPADPGGPGAPAGRGGRTARRLGASL